MENNKKTIRTITEIENWNRGKCDYCEDIPSNENSTHYVKIRNIKTNKLVVGGCLCLNCKEKFENNQFEMCLNCERVFKRGEQTWDACLCADLKDSSGDEEIEPERYSTQLEKQIHDLNIDKEELEEELEQEREAHLAGVEAASHFHKTTYEGEIQTLQQKIFLLEKEASTTSDALEPEEVKRARRLSGDNKELRYKVNDLETKLQSLELDKEHEKEEKDELLRQNQELKDRVERLENQLEQILQIAQVEQILK